ncbi:hypothetical protein FRB99_004879 [Tulasnella sp. 403]|nr:hypothetical protein FRB99_004879 [Tulasnella sp. 403]
MAPKTKRTTIVPSEAGVKDVSLHLMPFHIAYDGPAPLSTMWLVREDASVDDRDDVKAEEQTQTDAIMADDDPSKELSESQKVDAMPLEDTPTQRSTTSPSAFLKNKVAKLRQRFVSAFRGRRMHGTEVVLPEGYSGVVFSVPDVKVGSKRGRESDVDAGRPEKKIKASTRSTRRGRTGEVEIDGQDVEVEDGLEGSCQEEYGDTEVRRLVPTSTFSSFVIWNSDRRVDEGRDEYLRSLDEWVRMSALVHSV